MHKGTRKLTTMHKALHPWDDVAELFVSRKEGRRLASTEDYVDSSITRLEDHIKKGAGEDWFQRIETLKTTQTSTEEK